MHKIPFILHLKPNFFYFTPSFLQNTHISLSILQDISIKYSFFSFFLIISLNYHYIRAPSLFLSPFSDLLLSLYPSLATISSKSHLGQISLAPIRQDPSRSSSVQAKDPRAPIVPQAPIKTSSSQATIKTHEPQSSTDQNPQAPVKYRSRPTSSDQASIKTHELRSSTGQDPRAPIKH